MDFPTKASFVACDHPQLTLHCQTQLLGISRSRFYYQPTPVSPDDIRIMNLVDKVFTACPFYGSRKITEELKQTHHEQINRKRVQRLMREMGLEAIYPKSKRGLSDSSPEHKKYPYLLNNLAISNPNHVWGADFTYQGSHFTSPRYTDILLRKNIRISMDGRGRCMDNIFTERLWRTVKYEKGTL